MFSERMRALWAETRSALCVGLDPDLGHLPARFRDRRDGILDFNRAIIDATADLVCAFKPQIAYYSACGAEDQLAATIRYIRKHHPRLLIILDAKRGDIGPTAEMYAREAFVRYEADAVTVNPYMGFDALEPFLARKDRGVFVLCRTSNPSAGSFQDLELAGKPLYQQVAEQAAARWNHNGNVGLVVGATYPAQLQRLRATVADMPLLVPGVGAQGASIAAAVANGADSRGRGLVISSSRAVIFASTADDFASAARAAATSLRTEIERATAER